MNDRPSAQSMFNIAMRDLKAVRGMQDVAIFEDPIFGFHAQQCAEKLIKSWLTILNDDYPFTHDLRELIRHLHSASNINTPTVITRLADLSYYATTVRYVGNANDG